MVSDWSFFSFIVIFCFVIVAIVSKGGLSEARSISYSKNFPETPYTYSKTHTPKPPLIISPEENLDVKKFELFLAEGDIVIDRRRSVESQYYKTWFNRTVPYIFDLDFPLEGRWMVEEAMRDIQNRSCLHFKKRTQEVDYLRFKSDIGSASCYSAVGRTGGEQVLGLRDGCFVHGIIQHELLHALGFWHEHSRRDRDEYINVIWDNIPEVHKENFRLQTVLQSNELLLRMPYDYGSVMHYANNSFAKDRSRPTIVPTQELAGGQVMGQREGVSHGDVDKLNALYRCDIFNCTRPDPPSHGHVNGSDFSVGARISYGCEPDYLLIGAPERVCRDLGEWSGEQPSCLWPASQIYYCNFDSAQSPLCGMSQGTDEMLDWLHQTGPTLSKETGPYFDHTLATAYGGYLYVEASSVGSQPVGNVAKLILNNPLSTSHSSMTCLVFFTYMYGENMGSLKVYLSSSAQSGFTTTNQLFSMSGDQGQQWHQIFLVLPQSFQSGTILLEATVGNGYRSDIAIDDLVVAPCAQLGPLAASGSPDDGKNGAEKEKVTPQAEEGRALVGRKSQIDKV